MLTMLLTACAQGVTHTRYKAPAATSREAGGDQVKSVTEYLSCHAHEGL